MRSDAIFAVFVILLSSPSAARTEQFRTYVAPPYTETMKSPCEYELTLIIEDEASQMEQRKTSTTTGQKSSTQSLP